MADLRGCKLGEFVLRERIGGDDLGDVYRGEQPQLGRDVVVKVLHRRYDDDALQRYMHEARLDHPCAVHIYDFGVDQNGSTWIAMELARGVILKQWLETHGPMPLAQLAPFFDGLAEGIQVAHARGIVHHNLSSSNIMVIEGAGRLFPKLLDLGINQLTSSDAAAGLPEYKAPEQREAAHAAGPAADIYALGVIAYEALTGHVPFVAGARDEHGQPHGEAPVPPVGDDFSADLDPIFRRALAVNPSGRHSTALELAAELRGALRTNQREQLRSAAQQWEDRGRPRGLLWGSDVLANFAHWMRAPAGVLSEIERSFLARSEGHAKHARRSRLWLVALAAMVMVGLFLFWVVMQTRLARGQARMAQEVTEATRTQAELEQGRSALLHGRVPIARSAAPHLRDQREPPRSRIGDPDAFLHVSACSPIAGALGRRLPQHVRDTGRGDGSTDPALQGR